MTPQEFERSLNSASSELQGETIRKLAKIIGNRAVQLFKQNFLDEGFFCSKWKEVKRRLNQKTKDADALRRIITGRTATSAAPNKPHPRTTTSESSPAFHTPPPTTTATPPPERLPHHDPQATVPWNA